METKKSEFLNLLEQTFRNEDRTSADYSDSIKTHFGQHYKYVRYKFIYSHYYFWLGCEDTGDEVLIGVLDNTPDDCEKLKQILSILKV